MRAYKSVAPDGSTSFGHAARRIWNRPRAKFWKIEPTIRLIEFAQRGCQTCLILYHAIKTLSIWDSTTSIKIMSCSDIGQLEVSLNQQNGHPRIFYLAHPKGKFVVLSVQLLSSPLTYLGYNGYEPFGVNTLLAPVQPSPERLAYNTDAVIAGIQWSISGCVYNHTDCSSVSFAPTRVLDIDGGSLDSISLVECWPSFSSPYIALSHCWGKTQHVTTTKANYTKHQESIPISSLSRTFRDTIWMSQRLGIRYIWIDSLCIIQDDPLDWDREAISMYRIYGSAYVTLAAAHGADGDAGLFPRATEQQAELHIELKMSDGQLTLVEMEIHSEPHLDAESQVHKAYTLSRDHDSDPEPIVISPDVLQTRGWTFQERALSTRIVHFNRQEYVWECSNYTSCKCGGLPRQKVNLMTALMGTFAQDSEDDSDDSDANTDVSGSTDDGSYILPGSESVSRASDNPIQIWTNLVKLYTQRTFTKPQDRGPAFAGIAQTMYNLGKRDDSLSCGEYYAGLWECSMPAGLLWSCATDNILTLPSNCTGQRSGRIANAMAPSWSWFSIDGPCTFLTTHGRWSRFNITHETFDRMGVGAHDVAEETEFEFEFTSSTESPFGRLESSCLHINKPRIFKAGRSVATEPFVIRSPTPDKMINGSYTFYMISDDPSDDDLIGDISCLWVANGTHEVMGEVYQTREGKPIVDYELMDTEIGVYDCVEHRFGLVLVSVPGQVVTYRRVGVFNLEGNGCPGEQLNGDLNRRPCHVPADSGFLRDFKDMLLAPRRISLI